MIAAPAEVAPRRFDIPRPLLRAALAAGLLAPAVGIAAAPADFSFGIRGGEGAAYAGHQEFEGQELYLRAEPSAWRSQRDPLQGGLELGVGRIRYGSDSATALYLGPVVTWQAPVEALALEAGTRLTWLSRHEFDDRDLGGPFQFTTHIGLVWKLSRQFHMALRLQHTSNGGIYDENPGLDLQMLEVRYRY